MGRQQGAGDISDSGRRRAPWVAAVVAVAMAGALPGAAHAKAPPSAEAADTGAVLTSVTDAGADLYRQLRRGNTIFSPLSAAKVLAGLYAGTGGKDRSELAGLLRTKLPPERYAAGLGRLLAAFPPPVADAFELRSAGAVWSDPSLVPAEAFRQTLGRYGVEARQVDFATAPAEAAKVLDQWASDNTNGVIQQAFPPDAITAATRLVLADALYLLGRWNQPFAPSRTVPRRFTLADGRRIEVPTMHRTVDFGRYAEGKDWKATVLGYRGSAPVSMLLLVPRGRIGRLEKRLSAGFLRAVNAKLTTADVQLALPRFKMRSTFDLLPALRAQAPGAFGRRPDLRPMFPQTAPGDLAVEAARQAAYIEVDEEGTKAAAVTGIGIQVTSSPPLKRLTVDRPFLAVVQGPGAVPLFIARVMDPR